MNSQNLNNQIAQFDKKILTPLEEINFDEADAVVRERVISITNAARHYSTVLEKALGNPLIRPNFVFARAEDLSRMVNTPKGVPDFSYYSAVTQTIFINIDVEIDLSTRFNAAYNELFTNILRAFVYREEQGEEGMVGWSYNMRVRTPYDENLESIFRNENKYYFLNLEEKLPEENTIAYDATELSPVEIFKNSRMLQVLEAFIFRVYGEELIDGEINKVEIIMEHFVRKGASQTEIDLLSIEPQIISQWIGLLFNFLRSPNDFKEAINNEIRINKGFRIIMEFVLDRIQTEKSGFEELVREMERLEDKENLTQGEVERLTKILLSHKLLIYVGSRINSYESVIQSPAYLAFYNFVISRPSKSSSIEE